MIDPATLHRRARRVLPEKIGTDAVIVEAMDDATLTMLLAPLAHRRRGCLLFRLSSQTIAALVARAAGYLQDARQAREGLGRWTRPLTYTEWRSQGLGASQRFDTRSDDGRAALCLLPAAACAMYVWDDRGLQHTDLFPAPR